MSQYSDSNLWMTTKRIETLVDGIFAIAMTLLVLSIVVPDNLGSLSEAAFQANLTKIIPKLFIYGLSFLLLASFWRANHKQFYHIKSANPSFLTINIVWLMFVSLVPFSTTLMGEYGHYYTSNVIFQTNLFMVGILNYLIWYYAAKNNLVDEKMDPDMISRYKKFNLYLPILSLMAIVLSFFIYSWSSLIYLFGFIFRRL